MANIPEIEPIYSHDERGLASRIAFEWGHQFAWCEEMGKWLIRQENETTWGPDLMVQRTSFALDSAERHAEYAQLPRFLRLSSQKEALEFAKPLLAVKIEDFDRNPLALNTPGGVVDLRSGEMIPPHLVRMKYLKSTRVTPERTPTPLWDNHLRVMCKGDIELIAYLKRLAGITLIGDQNLKPHVVPQLNGLGRNGKGVFLQGLGFALGDYAQFASTRLLTTTENAHTTEQAGLRGMRLVVVEEVKRINSSILKDLTGGGSLRARMMYRDDVEFLKGWTLWFNNNGAMQYTGDQSDGLWQRVCRINLGRGIDEKDRISDMAVQIKKEVPGILQWMIDGLLDYYELDDICTPEAVKLDSVVARDDADPIRIFLNERYERDSNGRVLGSDFIKYYAAWCKERDERSGGMRSVYEDLRNRIGLEVKPGSGNKTYIFGLTARDRVMADYQSFN